MQDRNFKSAQGSDRRQNQVLAGVEGECHDSKEEGGKSRWDSTDLVYPAHMPTLI